MSVLKLFLIFIKNQNQRRIIAIDKRNEIINKMKDLIKIFYIYLSIYYVYGFTTTTTTTIKPQNPPTLIDLIPNSPEYKNLIDFVKWYVHLGLASRIEFIDSVDNSFRIRKENNDELKIVIDDKTSTQQKDSIINELIEYSRLRNRPYMDPNDLYYNIYGEHINEYTEIFLDNLNLGMVNWPLYVFDPNENTIHVRLNDTCFSEYSRNTERFRDTFPAIFSSNREDRRMTIKHPEISDSAIENRFLDGTPKEIIDELNKSGALTKHHIIPYNEIAPFFDRWHLILQYDYNHKKDDNRIRMSNMEYLNNMRSNIGDLMKIDRKIGHIADFVRSDYSTYEKKIITWSPGNIFWGPSGDNRGDDPKVSFEKTAKIIIPEDYYEYLENYEDIVKINDEIDKIIKKPRNAKKKLNEDENDAKKLLNEYSDLCKRVEDRAHRVIELFKRTTKQNGLIFGRKFNYRYWKKINSKWFIKTPEEYTVDHFGILKDEKKFFSKRPPSREDDDEGNSGCKFVPSLENRCGSNHASKAKRNTKCMLTELVEKVVKNTTTTNNLMCEYYNNSSSKLITYKKFIEEKLMNENDKLINLVPPIDKCAVNAFDASKCWMLDYKTNIDSIFNKSCLSEHLSKKIQFYETWNDKFINFNHNIYALIQNEYLSNITNKPMDFHINDYITNKLRDPKSKSVVITIAKNLCKLSNEWPSNAPIPYVYYNGNHVTLCEKEYGFWGGFKGYKCYDEEFDCANRYVYNFTRFKDELRK